MKKVSVVLGVLVILVVAGGLLYYLNADSASNHYSKGNISFNYPNEYHLDSNQVGTENASGYFVTAVDAPDNSSSIVIYEIPVASNVSIPLSMLKMMMTSQQSSPSAQQSSPSAQQSDPSAQAFSPLSQQSGNSALISMFNETNKSKNVIVNVTNNTTATTLTVDNIQLFLNGLQNRNGNFTNTTKNDYIYYVIGVLNSSYASYGNGSRIVSSQPLTIKDTVIVKGGNSNFYLIEYLSSDNSTNSLDAYSMIVNTFKIGS